MMNPPFWEIVVESDIETSRGRKDDSQKAGRTTRETSRGDGDRPILLMSKRRSNCSWRRLGTAAPQPRT